MIKSVVVRLIFSKERLPWAKNKILIESLKTPHYGQKLPRSRKWARQKNQKSRSRKARLILIIKSWMSKKALSKINLILKSVIGPSKSQNHHFGPHSPYLDVRSKIKTFPHFSKNPSTPLYYQNQNQPNIKNYWFIISKSPTPPP